MKKKKIEATNSERKLLQQLIKRNLQFWQRAVGNVDEADIGKLIKDDKRFQQAIGKALGTPELWEQAADTLLDMFVYISRLRLERQWDGWIAEAIKTAPTPHKNRYCHLLIRHGQTKRYLHGAAEIEEAIGLHNQALTLTETLPDPVLQSLCLVQLSDDYRVAEQPTKAVTLAAKAAELALTHAAPIAYLAAAYTSNGLNHMELHQLKQSEEYLERAIAQFKKGELWVDLGLGLVNLGVCYERQGRIQDSLAVYDQALEIFEEAEAQYQALFLSGNMAAAYYQQGNFERAQSLFLQMDSSYMIANNYLRQLAIKNHGLGDVAHALGNPEKALPYLDEAVRRWQALNQPLRVAYSVATREGVHLDLENIELAENDYNWARRLIANAPEQSLSRYTQGVLDKWQQRRANWPYGKSSL